MGKILDSDKAPLIFIGAVIVITLGVIGYFWWHNKKVDNFLSEHSCTIVSDKRVPFTTYIMSGNVLVPITNYVGPVTYDCDFGKHIVNYN